MYFLSTISNIKASGQIVKYKQKDNETATKWREIADSYFIKDTKEDYLLSLVLFNKAICFAPKQSENLYISVANRSAVYFDLEMYDECLTNINFLKKINPLCQVAETLIKRKEICEQFIAKDKKSKFEPMEPKLNFKPHKRIPYIGNCLDLSENGHYIVTKSELSVGKIVAILDPLYVVLPTEHQYVRCHNCCKENFRNLLSCPKCATVMFCDQTCFKEAMDSFHKYECSVIDYIIEDIELRTEKMALRIMLCGLSICQTVDDFLSLTTLALKKTFNIFITNGNRNEANYGYFCSMSTEFTIKTQTDCEKLFTVATKILEINEMSSTKNPDTFNEMLRYIIEQFLFIVEMYGTSHHDFFNHITNLRSPSDKAIVMDGAIMAIYPFMKLLRHSCIPNAIFSNAGNKKIISIVQPIKAGHPLLLSFCPPYFEANREERQKRLAFSCECIACEKNYPLLENLPNGETEIPFNLKIATLAENKFDRNVSLFNYENVVDYLQENHKQTKESAMVFNYYAHIMNVIFREEISIAMRIGSVEHSNHLHDDFQKILNS